MINALPLPRTIITSTPPITNYIADSTREDSPLQDDPPLATPDNPSPPYSAVPRSDHAKAADARLALVKPWLQTLKQPDNMDDPEYKTFMRYCTEFFIASDLLWRKAPNRQHKIVVLSERRLFLIASAHDDDVLIRF